MNDLDKKLNDYFTGYVVRKDLVKQVSSNAAVPGYVLEYLLGQKMTAGTSCSTGAWTSGGSSTATTPSRSRAACPRCAACGSSR